jgi:hypothetical protein
MDGIGQKVRIRWYFLKTQFSFGDVLKKHGYGGKLQKDQGNDLPRLRETFLRPFLEV